MSHSDTTSHPRVERIWSFIYDEADLSLDEQRHLNVCLECATVFRLCVTCDTLDCVLKELDRYEDTASAA